MTGRMIVYIILTGILILMGYFGLRIGVMPLAGLAGAGIIFLVYSYFASPRE
jgi:hypothetical protein